MSSIAGTALKKIAPGVHRKLEWLNQDRLRDIASIPELRDRAAQLERENAELREQLARFEHLVEDVQEQLRENRIDQRRSTELHEIVIERLRQDNPLRVTGE